MSMLDDIMEKIYRARDDGEMPSFLKGSRKYMAVGALATAMTAACSIHTTGSTEIGVRTAKMPFFEASGVKQDVYAPGSTYFFLPVINDWHKFDTKLVNIDMSEKSEHGQGEIVFKTIDGNDINLDINFAVRIDPARAPYVLQYVASDMEELKEKIVERVVRSRPRDIFGELTTQRFYNAQERGVAAEKSKVALQQILNDFGVIVENVDPKDYRFDPEYADAVKRKMTAEVNTGKLLSEQKAVAEGNLANLAAADGEVNKMTANADGNYQRAVVTADAYYDQQERLANAIVTEGKAQAESVTKARQAMINSGGTTYVKMKIAEALKGKKIVMVPGGDGSGLNMNTFDVNKFLAVYGLKTLPEQQK